MQQGHGEAGRDSVPVRMVIPRREGGREEGLHSNQMAAVGDEAVGVEGPKTSMARDCLLEQ